EVTAQLEVIVHGSEPATMLRIEKVTQYLPACLRRATVFDLQALAIVGDNRKEVGSGASALARPKGLEQARGQSSEAQQLQGGTHDAQRHDRRGAVSPRNQQCGQEQHSE